MDTWYKIRVILQSNLRKCNTILKQIFQYITNELGCNTPNLILNKFYMQVLSQVNFIFTLRMLIIL